MPQIKLIVTSDDGQKSAVLDLVRETLMGTMTYDEVIAAVKPYILKAVTQEVAFKVTNATVKRA